MFDQALHPAKTFGEGEDLHPFQHAPRTLQPAPHDHGDDAAEAAGHLPLGEGVLGMALQARIDHPLDGLVAFQEAGDLQAAFAMLALADGQGLHAAQGQEAVEGAGDGADRVLQEGQALDQVLILAHRHAAADDVGMAVQILGGGVHDDIDAELQRPLAVGAGEGVVGRGEHGALLAQRRDGFEVAELQHWVGGGLDPDQLGVGPDGRLHRLQVREIDEAELQPRAAPSHLVEQAEGAAVKVVRCDHVVA